MGYIYATALPRDIVKIGRCTDDRERPFAAQSYYVERVQLLAVWETGAPERDERRAHDACARWYVRGELFRVPTDWLDLEHPAVAAISAVLGAPSKGSRRRHLNPARVLKAVHKPRLGTVRTAHKSTGNPRGRPPKGGYGT